ncbi:MAG: hypothetical protein M3065_21205 [Actinomycetota bacterium]|nr:hypothetical protein [Actinomycetota bacterium]
MKRLIQDDSTNADVIFPYIGGQEVNNSPRHEHHRYAIDFFDRDEEECRRRWPQLMAIVEAQVKPERMTDNRASYRRYWWQYGEKRLDLRSAIAGLDRVLVTNSGATPHLALAFQPSDRVLAHTLAVFPLTTSAAFCALQARPHEIWARFFGSTLEDRLRYTPSDCFETFPFPHGWQDHPALETAGRAYYDFRADLMVRNDEGMTKAYNRFHDPEERDPDITKLRALHAEVDRAVLAAYGWDDIPTDCDFILDYEVEDDESGRRKKPYRFRWPDVVRDEVLARLIELNGERAAAEQRARLATQTTRRRPARSRPAPQREGLL